MEIADLPALSAALNAVATLLLVTGFVLIKKGKLRAHPVAMIAAFCVSVLFLINYLIYHFNTQAVTRFAGPDWMKPLYLIILISHIVLAAVVPPLCIMTIYRAWRGQFDKHRRIARVTFPIWLYVSISGVVIYWVLYQWYPAPS